MLNRKPLLIIVLLFVLAFEGIAQDAQFSQFYSAPLYLNPAFAGATKQGRVGVNYRNQWPSLPTNAFVTYSAYFDYFLERYNSGVGVIVNADREGIAGLRMYDISVIYAYQLELTDWLTFRPGFQFGYDFRTYNYNNLIFPDQINEAGIISGGTNEPLDGGLVRFFDLALGGVFYTPDAWLGVSVHHVNSPNQSIAGAVEPLQQRISVHTGYKFRLTPLTIKRDLNQYVVERSIAPGVQYKRQGNFQQLDINTYVTYVPVFLGVGYRGMFLNSPRLNTNLSESVIVIAGYTFMGLNIGYSFDFPISSLGIASGGAHEISISLEFPRDPRIPPLNDRLIPCPKF